MLQCLEYKQLTVHAPKSNREELVISVLVNRTKMGTYRTIKDVSYRRDVVALSRIYLTSITVDRYRHQSITPPKMCLCSCIKDLICCSAKVFKWIVVTAISAAIIISIGLMIGLIPDWDGSDEQMSSTANPTTTSYKANPSKEWFTFNLFTEQFHSIFLLTQSSNRSSSRP